MMPPLFLSPKVWHHFPVPALLCAREDNIRRGKEGGERDGRSVSGRGQESIWGRSQRSLAEMRKDDDDDDTLSVEKESQVPPTFISVSLAVLERYYYGAYAVFLLFVL